MHYVLRNAKKTKTTLKGSRYQPYLAWIIRDTYVFFRFKVLMTKMEVKNKRETVKYISPVLNNFFSIIISLLTWRVSWRVIVLSFQSPICSHAKSGYLFYVFHFIHEKRNNMICLSNFEILFWLYSIFF